jgi:hypothetical protein
MLLPKYRDGGRRIVVNNEPDNVHISVFQLDALIEFEATLCGESHVARTWHCVPPETPVSCVLCLGHVAIEVEDWDGPSR